jgi:nucleotide-binding universal stress UspA family protein
MAVGEPADRVAASAPSGQPWGSVAEQRLRSSAAMVSEAVRAVEAIGIEASGEAVPGFASDRLQRLSEQVDLPVVGSGSHGAVRRALLGSTAEGLLQNAHCPVLVVPCDAVRSEPGTTGVNAA